MGMVVGAFALGVVTVLVVVAALFGLMRLRAGGPPALTATATQLTISTQAAQIPTTTPQPPMTPTDTVAPPTGTRPPPSATSEVTPTKSAAEGTAGPTKTADVDGPLLTADVGANVRSGPSTDYPVVASLTQGQTASVLGRNAAGTWFVIAVPNGQGWVADQVATFDGNIHSLEVVAAPPPPAASATPRPSTAAAPAQPQIVTVRGMSGRLSLCTGRTTYSSGERVCFLEWIKNTTADTIGYGVLGVRYVNVATNSGGFHTSWNGELANGGKLSVEAGCEGPITHPCRGTHEDGVIISAPGSYRLTMQICFSDFNTCIGPEGDWATLSSPIVITVN